MSAIQSAQPSAVWSTVALSEASRVTTNTSQTSTLDKSLSVGTHNFTRSVPCQELTWQTSWTNPRASQTEQSAMDIQRSHDRNTSTLSQKNIQATTIAEPWSIDPAYKARLDSIFATIDKSDQGFITGEQSVEFFAQSKLNESELAQIWDLADINSDGHLDRDEFAVAMHLIKQRRASTYNNIPGVLPIALIPPAMRGKRYGLGPVGDITPDLLDDFDTLNVDSHTNVQKQTDEDVMNSLLDRMRGSENYQHLARAIQQYPTLLDSMLRGIGEDDPRLLEIIAQNSNLFLQLLRIDIDPGKISQTDTDHDEDRVSRHDFSAVDESKAVSPDQQASQTDIGKGNLSASASAENSQITPPSRQRNPRIPVPVSAISSSDIVPQHTSRPTLVRPFWNRDKMIDHYGRRCRRPLQMSGKEPLELPAIPLDPTKLKSNPPPYRPLIPPQYQRPKKSRFSGIGRDIQAFFKPTASYTIAPSITSRRADPIIPNTTEFIDRPRRPLPPEDDIDEAYRLWEDRIRKTDVPESSSVPSTSQSSSSQSSRGPYTLAQVFFITKRPQKAFLEYKHLTRATEDYDGKDVSFKKGDYLRYCVSEDESMSVVTWDGKCGTAPRGYLHHLLKQQISLPSLKREVSHNQSV